MSHAALQKYQFWLCDAFGNRLTILDDVSYVSYSRSNHGYGTIEIGVPYRLIAKPHVYFEPDWRIDVWRKPDLNLPMRRESSYLIRKFRMYERESDGMLMMVYYGRSPIDLLRRFGCWRLDTTNLLGEDGNVEDYTYEWDTTGGSYPGNIGTAMELIAYGNFSGVLVSDYYPRFTVATNPLNSLAPPLANYYTFGRNALELISELSDTSIAMNLVSPTLYKKVYFDVVEVPHEIVGGAPTFDYQFRTYIGLRGVDRTVAGVVFSTQNGNLIHPVLNDDWLDEYNIVISFNKSANLIFATQNTDHSNASPYNKNYLFISTSQQTLQSATTEARAALKRNGRQKTISATFLDSPGGKNQPRSLYGLDWDLGDLVTVRFGGYTFECEVMIVYVSVDEDGRESVTGRNEVGA